VGCAQSAPLAGTEPLTYPPDTRSGTNGGDSPRPGLVGSRCRGSARTISVAGSPDCRITALGHPSHTLRRPVPDSPRGSELRTGQRRLLLLSRFAGRDENEMVVLTGGLHDKQLGATLYARVHLTIRTRFQPSHEVRAQVLRPFLPTMVVRHNVTKYDDLFQISKPVRLPFRGCRSRRCVWSTHLNARPPANLRG
jgi:hypothetical protein